MEKVSFAIVGCGRIGNRHAEHIARLGHLAAVCDVVPERARKIADQHGCKVYTSLEEMLADGPEADVVSVCTPNGLHAQHTISALKAGYHVLCEKPMATNTSDALEMMNAAENANRRLFIVKQNRYNPPVAALKKLIDEGRLGKILSAQLNCFWNRNEAYFANSWKGTKELDGGILFTQFSHFVDLLYWLVGDVRQVHSFSANLNHADTVEFEDQAVAVLEFVNGALGTAHFTINAHGKNMEGSITLFGEKGTVKIGGQYLNELEYQNISEYEITGLPAGNPPNNYGTYVGSMSNHDKIYENVIDVLRNGGVIGTNGIEGMKTVQIIEKIYEAANRG